MLGAHEQPDIWGSPYELAAHWANRTAWPTHDQMTLADALHEVAVIAALADWLRNWLPLHMHYALVRGADVNAVAGAAGIPAPAVRQLWEPWAARQVDLWRTSNPDRRIGLEPDVADLVRAVLSQHGPDGQTHKNPARPPDPSEKSRP